MTADPFPARCRRCDVAIMGEPMGDWPPDFCGPACDAWWTARRSRRRLRVLALLERARVVRARIRARFRPRA